MDTQITPFNFKGASVRAVMIDGEPWFVGKDVCEVMGLQDWRRSVNRLDERDRRIAPSLSPGGEQEMSVVNESGIYAMAFRSRKEQAREWAHHVTSVILPSIRKTGTYVAPGAEVAIAPTDVNQQILLMMAQSVALLTGKTTAAEELATQAMAASEATALELERIAAAQQQEATWRREHDPERTHALVGDFNKIKGKAVAAIVSRRPEAEPAKLTSRFHREFTTHCKEAAGIHGKLTPGLITVTQGTRLVEKAIERSRELGVTGVAVPLRFA